jgi:hypothetical protein
MSAATLANWLRLRERFESLLVSPRLCHAAKAFAPSLFEFDVIEILDKGNWKCPMVGTMRLSNLAS